MSTEGRIYTNQPIELSTTWEENGEIINITGGTIVYYYYYPSNQTSTPDGNVSGTILVAESGTSEGILPASVNTVERAGTVMPWRVQGKLTLSGDTYAEWTTSFRTHLDGT